MGISGAPAGRTGPGTDAALRGLRAAGRSWQAIGAALGVAPSAARERARRIGATRPDPTLPEAQEARAAQEAARAMRAAARDAADRPALPAGHPASWGALLQGGLLDGTAWPVPPPLGAAWPDDVAAARALCPGRAP